MAKIPKPSRWGSVLGAPMEMAAGMDEGRLLGCVYVVAAAVGRRVRSRKRGQRFMAKIPKPSRWGSVLGAPMEMAAGIAGGR
jgi:hypothetical protein